MKFLFALLAVIAVAAANDFQIANPYITFPSFTSVNSYVALQNLYPGTLNSVSYQLSSSDPNMVFSYGGLLESVVGNIQDTAVGYGGFNAISLNANVYTVSVTVTYQRGSSSDWSEEVHTITIAVYDEEDYKREASADVLAADVEEDTLTARTAYITNGNSGGYIVTEGSVNWVTLNSHTGTSSLTSVTFSVVPDTPSVTVSYPTGTGNSLGNIAANTEKDVSIGINSQTYDAVNLNVTYKFKVGSGGSYQYLSYTIPLSTCVPGSCSRRQVRSEVISNEPVIAENQPVQYVYVAAAGAGVAVVAVVAIVGTLLYRRRSTDTVSA